VEFLLSVDELLFLSLAVEALQGKMCQNSLPLGGGRSLGAKISGEGVVSCEYIDTTRKAVDCSTTLPLRDCENLNRLTGNSGCLHSAHWLASSLKLAARCPVSGCWPSCF